MNRDKIKQLALQAGFQLVPQDNCTFDLPENVYRFVELLMQESRIDDFVQYVINYIPGNVTMGDGGPVEPDALIKAFERYQKYKADGEFLCPGCDVHITPGNAGGYRNYCDKCVSVFPDFPRRGGGQHMTGRFPRFQWHSPGVTEPYAGAMCHTCGMDVESSYNQIVDFQRKRAGLTVEQLSTATGYSVEQIAAFEAGTVQVCPDYYAGFNAVIRERYSKPQPPKSTAELDAYVAKVCREAFGE